MKGSQSGQRGFSDHLLQSKVSEADFLVQIESLIDWQPLDDALSACYSDMGRPSEPPLVLLKMQLLQKWFGLSDPAVEAQCKDRLSYHRFLGLSLEDSIPDETTLVKFRQRLRKHTGVSDRLFALVDAQLEGAGIVVKQGTLIDASIIQSSRKPPSKYAKRDSSDNEARWTTKNGKSTHGYKVHIGTDMGSDVVRSIEMTPANVHDSRVCDALIKGDEAAVFADKAYHSVARSKRLKASGQINGILRRAKRNHPLDAHDRAINRVAGKLRAPVERVFGDWKQHRNLRRVRYVGLERNQQDIQLMAMAHNLRCWLRQARKDGVFDPPHDPCGGIVAP